MRLEDLDKQVLRAACTTDFRPRRPKLAALSMTLWKRAGGTA